MELSGNFPSDFPPQVREVRAFQITVGRERLPRELPTPAIDPPDSTAEAVDQPPGDPFLPPPASPSSWPSTYDRLPPLRQPGAQSPNAPSRPIIPSRRALTTDMMGA